METKINLLFIYPNDQYDFRIIDAVNIAMKYESKCTINVFQQNQPYEKLSEYTEEFKNQIKGVIMPNARDGIIDHVIKNFKNINWIQAMGTGIDKILANQELKTNKLIVLSNLKSSSDVLLSEFAIAGCLYFAKKFKFYLNLIEQKQWVDRNYFEIEELDQKTILIVGLGSIGESIAKKAKFGFNMKVLGIKRNLEKNKNQFSNYVDVLGTLENLQEYCNKADFIVNCLPTIPNVQVIYTEEVFNAMKQNAVFVNVARGVAVDESALMQALLNNKLSGAALDVVSKEPLDFNHPFYTNSLLKDKILMTCHSQDKGKQYERQMCFLYEENLKKYLNNEKVNHIIDKYLGY